MISGVDSSVILDVLADNPEFAEGSERALRQASREGQLVICECVLAEVYPALGSQSACEGFLADWQLDYVPSSRDAAVLAGRTFAQYLTRGGVRGRIVADFLIAAHAQVQGDRLIARDRGFLRDYFRGLTVVDPSTGADA